MPFVTKTLVPRILFYVILWYMFVFILVVQLATIALNSIYAHNGSSGHVESEAKLNRNGAL